MTLAVQTLEIILMSVGAAAAFGYYIWLRAQPEQHGDCPMKPPGFHGYRGGHHKNELWQKK